MASQDELLERQRVLARFGQLVLDCDDLDILLNEACRLIAEALDTDLAKILEIERDDGTALVRAGVGSNDDVIGRARIRLDERSSEAFAIESGEPLITRDIVHEERFDFPGFMRDHGVVALVNVPIMLPGKRPFGVLQVDAREPRAFDQDDIDFLRTYAMTLGPVIDRLGKLRQLEHAGTLHRLIVENARDYAIFLTDLDDRITDWLPGAEAVFGWSQHEAVGQLAEIIFTPEDREAGIPQLECEGALRDGRSPNVRWHIRKDGSRVFIDGQTTALKDARGRATGFMKIGQDVTDRRCSENAARVSAERLELALRTARLGTWDWDIPSNTVDWSEEHYRLEGYEPGEIQPSYEAWAARVHPEDRAATEQELIAAREEKRTYTAEFRVVHPDGKTLWCSALGCFFYDDNDQPYRMIGVMQDITLRREWENRQQILVRELQHRTRNLIGVVRSVAEKTARNSATLEDFRPRFRDRLEALARVQGLLSRTDDVARVTFGELIRSELAAMDGDLERVRLDGPPGVILRSSTVQTLAMALHELATNAMKYGALAQPAGTLTITWRTTASDGGGRPVLHIDWREAGVVMPAADAPARGSGQGRDLIEKALPYQLNAKTTYTLKSDGVHCTITLPISNRTEADDDG